MNTQDNLLKDEADMCSFCEDDMENMCSNKEYDTCRDCGVTAKKELVEILEFMHFFEHYTFGETDWSHRGKHLEKYIRVVVAVELVTVTAKPE